MALAAQSQGVRKQTEKKALGNGRLLKKESVKVAGVFRRAHNRVSCVPLRIYTPSNAQKTGLYTTQPPQISYRKQLGGVLCSLIDEPQCTYTYMQLKEGVEKALRRCLDKPEKIWLTELLMSVDSKFGPHGDEVARLKQLRKKVACVSFTFYTHTPTLKIPVQ
jgi:hypothetical protein